ncbi:KLHL2_3 [Mytilus edulis]|uniref:KLHL2_3 n=1 Tax=Mytilus edulis TaxID=6550 RepID=A0A8S3VA95_MYTED|nr:KLHL2_3 [Mytilus edulis]
MAALDGYIYAIGGFDGTSRLSTVEKYCPKTNKWSFVASLAQLTSRIFAVGLNGYLYAAEGDVDPGNSTMVDAFIRYNHVCDVWENLKKHVILESSKWTGYLEREVYAVGGITEGVYSSKDLECYDLDRCMDMSVSNDGIQIDVDHFPTGVTAFNNQIFVLGGNDGGNSFYSNIESYDTTEDKWKVMASLTLPYGRCRFTAVAMGTQQT